MQVYRKRQINRPLKIDFEFTTTIFVHDVLNPPTPNRGSDVCLKIYDSKELKLSKIEFTDKIGPPRTSYDLKIYHPLAIGFTSGDRSKSATEFKNLVLAMNLSLCRACITDSNILFTSPTIQYKAMGLKNEVGRMDDIVHAYSENVIVVSDEAFAWVSLSENISENYTLDLFKTIQNFKAIDIMQNLPYANLTKAITEYERSMTENSTLFIFKNLFNALELSTNSHQEYTSNEFDTIVSENTTIPSDTVKEWRIFYNRIKHVDESEEQYIAFVSGKDKLTSMICPMRSSTKKTIVKLLNLI